MTNSKFLHDVDFNGILVDFLMSLNNGYSEIPRYLNFYSIIGVAKLSQYEYELTFTYNFLTVTVKPHMVGK